MTMRIFRGASCATHKVDASHPESPDRLYAIDDQLLISGLDMVLEHVNAQPVTAEVIKLAHDDNYVDRIFEQAPTHETIWLDDDTAMTPNTLKAATEAAGAGVAAVDYVMSAKDRRGFCAVRPPGHHAEYDKAMGFCVFNNIAIAAYWAIEHYQMSRLAIVDFDVHHGNGTHNIVANDSRIQFYSSFQHPFYPYSGIPSGADNVHVVPLDAGTRSAEYRESVAHWFDSIRQFDPELILVSAGFDAHAEDPLGHLRLTEEDYRWISESLRDVADECCDGRIVSMLEGGYDLSALGRSMVAHIRGLEKLSEHYA